MPGKDFVGVDVGGTKVLAVRIDEQGVVQQTATRPMPGRTSVETDLEAAVAAAARDVIGGADPVAAGVAAAGLVDADGQRYLFGAHLPWRNAPVRERLEQRLGLPVVLDNDANCALWAELAAGVARGRRSVLMVTIGTGIGGAIALDGRLVRGAHGLAGEFGHMQVVPDGLRCECGLHGCWEQYCSGRALERVTRVAVGRHLEGPEVTALARAGNEVARQSIASVGTWLGVGVAGLVSAFDPELVVVGGGVSAVGDLLLDPARDALRASLQGESYRQVPDLVSAAFGPDAGAVGAALLARDGR